jgi:RHS repeat-associated protein
MARRAGRPPPQKNRVWSFENTPSDRPNIEAGSSWENATGSVQYTYQIASGRAEWLSRDPIGESGGMDLYEYVGDNSITRSDLLGLAWTEKPGSIKLTSLWTSTGVRYDWEIASGEGVTIADDIFGEYAASAEVTCVCNGKEKQATGIRVAERDLNTGLMPIRTSPAATPIGVPATSSFFGAIGKILAAITKKRDSQDANAHRRATNTNYKCS